MRPAVSYSGSYTFRWVLIVAFHNVWHGAPLVLTLVGYSLVLKSLGYFVFPKRGLKTLSRVSLERSWEFVVAGLFSVALSVLLMFILLRQTGTIRVLK